MTLSVLFSSYLLTFFLELVLFQDFIYVKKLKYGTVF